jgi:hypothetical protein
MLGSSRVEALKGKIKRLSPSEKEELLSFLEKELGRRSLMRSPASPFSSMDDVVRRSLGDADRPVPEIPPSHPGPELGNDGPSELP